MQKQSRINELEQDQRRNRLAWLGNPEVWLFIIVFLTAALIHPGNLGIDTERRLQVTHSFWTDAPPVKPGEWPGFGVKGRDGVVHAWNSIGQSLVMLPADIAATGILSFTNLHGKIYEKAKAALVGYMVFPLISVLVILVSYKFLLLLGLSIHRSLFCALGLLFLTTFMHYTQRNVENSLLLLLLLCGFFFMHKWLESGFNRHLILGAALPGFGILCRLPNLADLAALFVFASIVLIFDERHRKTGRGELLRSLRKMAVVFLATALFYLFWDRLYQWIRFGSVLTTTYHLHGEEYRTLYPNLPRSFPFSTPFPEGFFGALFSPARSIFLFDLPLVLCLVYAVTLWRVIEVRFRALIISAALLLLVFVSFYAMYYTWAGEHAWGDRYVSVPVEFLAMMGLAVLAKYYDRIKKLGRALAYALLPLSLLIQIASTFFTCSLEEWQRPYLEFEFVIGLRFANIAGLIFGKADDWGLDRFPTWDNFSTPNYFPFQIAEHVSRPLGTAVAVLWVLGFLALVGVAVLFVKQIRHKTFDNVEGSR